jgi:hypothetical protein
LVRTLVILSTGVLVGAVVYLASNGHLVFLPIILLLPLGLLTWRRR